MKNLSIITFLTLLMASTTFAGDVQVHGSSGLMATLTNSCGISSSGGYAVIKNKSKSIIFAKGSKVRWKTSALETSTYGLSHDVHPGKKFKIPIKEKASDCKAKVFLP